MNSAKIKDFFLLGDLNYRLNSYSVTTHRVYFWFIKRQASRYLIGLIVAMTVLVCKIMQ